MEAGRTRSQCVHLIPVCTKQRCGRDENSHSSLLKLNVRNGQGSSDQEGIGSAPDSWAVEENFLESDLVTLGQQALVAALVMVKWR